MVGQGGSSEEEAVVEDERYSGGGRLVPSRPGQTARVGEADEKYQGRVEHSHWSGGSRSCSHWSRPL